MDLLLDDVDEADHVVVLLIERPLAKAATSFEPWLIHGPLLKVGHGKYERAAASSASMQRRGVVCGRVPK